MSEPGRDEFLLRYGGIYEHSPWVAAEAWPRGAHLSASELPALFAAVVAAAGRERQLALICAHPDLAGRAAVAGQLTEASGDEQSSARLDRCTPGELREFQTLNRAYREKFGFPFVMAIRDRTRQEILAAFRARLANGLESEFRTALEEIHKIAKLRFEAL